MEGWSPDRVGLVLIGALLFLVVDLLLSIALAAISTLSRVALHRLASECRPELAFLGTLRDPRSPHRTATYLMRQISLLAAVLLIVLAARHAGWTHPVAAGIAVGALVDVLVLELLVGRWLGMRDPRRALRVTAFLIRASYVLVFPVIRPLQFLLERVTPSRSLVEASDEEQEEEVEAFIEVGEREGILEAGEGEMMRGIVDLDETHVREIMTPRTDIVALPLETTMINARDTVLRSAHSRIPVYRGTIDNIVGMLHERDLLRAWEAGHGEQPISRHLREVIFVPESLSVAQVLAEMRLRTHVAMVVDEYGGVAGLVTLEDVLEEIVGDIRDEHDREEAPIRQEVDGSWVINAATHVEELQELFGLALERRDFDTVGGLVVAGFGRVPAPGEILDIRNLSIEVLEADRRRIRLVRIRPRSPDSSETGAGAGMQP